MRFPGPKGIEGLASQLLEPLDLFPEFLKVSGLASRMADLSGSLSVEPISDQ